MNNRLKSTVIIYFFLGFSSYSLSKDISAPEVKLNESAIHTTQATQSFTLEKAIEYDLLNNLDVLIAQQRIAQAEAQLSESRASFYPQIKARYSYEYTENPARVFSHTINQRQLDFNSDFNHPGGRQNFRPEVIAQFSIYRGGQDYHLSKAAELGIEVATLKKSAIRNQLTQAVTSSFYGYLAAEEIHKVTLRSITAVDSELNQSRNRLAAGAALKSDVLTLEVKRAETHDAEIRAKNAIELAKTGIKTLLGLPIEQTLELVSRSEWQLPSGTDIFSDLLTLALKQRPEILAAEKQIEILQSQLNAAQGAHLPRADAFVSYGQDSQDGSFSSNRDHFTTGVSVELDIFSGFATSERVRKTQRKLAETELFRNRVKLDIENEVKTAFLKQQEALTRVAVTSASISSAEEALHLVNEQRQAGVVTITRYLEAEVARDKAYSSAIAARFDALRAAAALKKAQGAWN